MEVDIWYSVGLLETLRNVEEYLISIYLLFNPAEAQIHLK